MISPASPFSMPANLDAFGRILHEWRLLGGTRSWSDTWGPALERMSREEEQLRSRGAWTHGPDDMFGVVDIARAEIRHSAAIAWLLNPCGRHGLGDSVLQGLLLHAFADPGRDLMRARVRCEVAVGHCRADIVVNLPAFTLVIENKVDAPESPRQCDILFDRFPGARFVFLTPDGGAPSTATGDAAAAFQRVSYGRFRDILTHALGARTGNGPGRSVAEDYLRT